MLFRKGGLVMQHDDKLVTMKLIMLSSEGEYHGTTILILILVRLQGVEG
jgi:putative lipoic acid-binding regulatory protein